MRLTKPLPWTFLAAVILAAAWLWTAAVLPITPSAAQETGVTPEPTGEPPAQEFALPITADVTYIVEPRDTLDGIGALFDVRVACIREVNNLRPADILRPGDALVISTACPAYDGIAPVEFPRLDSPGRTGEDGTYAVRPNDTLDTIAQQFNVSVIALAEANDITEPRRLSIGTLLEIPADAPAYGVVPARVPTGPDGAQGELPAGPLVTTLDEIDREAGGNYVVQPGDTLDTIGQALNVSVVTLQIENSIGFGRDLTAGTVLVIPADAPAYGVFPVIESADADGVANLPDGERYVIQPNDTLDTIAQEFNVSVVALRVVNNIDAASQLRPGREIVIPADAPPYGTFPSLDEPAGAVLASGEVYVIQPGDTLDGIAAEFNRDTLCIIQANEIENVRLIRAGQTIGIPGNCPEYVGYNRAPAATPAPVVTPTS
jgi:LysM repeat protein